MIRSMVKILPIILIALCLNAYSQPVPQYVKDCLQKCKSDNKSCIGSSDNKLDECMATEDEITCMLAHNKRMEKCKISDKVCAQKCSQSSK